MKINNWNLEKVYLAVGGCLLVVYGGFLVICARLLVVYDLLCSFVVVGCFSNYGS